MSQIKFLQTLAIFSLPAFSLWGCRSAEKDSTANRPNVIFFIADDMYPEMFNCYPEGKGQNLTPNLDFLAKEGVVMANQYCVSPVSTASRYNCLTGSYASRATNKKMLDFSKTQEDQRVIQWNSFITEKDRTLATYLKEAGYTTGFVGKNHVVEDDNQVDQNKKPNLLADPNDPVVKEQLAFQQYSLSKSIKKCGFDFAEALYHDNPDWLGIKALASQNMDWITDAGLRFIDKSNDKPFFLYLATTLPHIPNDPEHSWNADPKITAVGYLDKKLNVQPERATIPARLKKAGLDGKGKENLLWMDDALGALISKLKETGKFDNTIIVFFNDNGQKAKGTLYQGGIKSQCIIWKSKGFKCGKSCDAQVANVDFLPTVLDLCGIDKKAVKCDGFSFAAALNGAKANRRETLYFELGYAKAVVKGNYKYLALRYPEFAMKYSLEERKKMLETYSLWRESFGNERITNDFTLPYGQLEMIPGGGGAEHEVFGTKPGFADADQLYDVNADPNEMDNLAKKVEYKEKLMEMKTVLKSYTNQLPGKFKI